MNTEYLSNIFIQITCDMCLSSFEEIGKIMILTKIDIILATSCSIARGFQVAREDWGTQ